MLDKLAHWLTRKPKLVMTAAVLLMIPAALGYIATRVNYDVLSYIPQDLPAAQGEKLLEDPFHMAATNMLIVEGMPSGYADQLVKDIKKIDGVSNALWISNVVGVQMPIEMIPAQFRDLFFADEATMIVIQYSHAGASDETIHAIDEIRALCNEKCFLAGFSVVTKDTQDLMNNELVRFVAVAVALGLTAMALCLESTVLPFVLILSIGVAVVYNLGTNVFFGEISFLTKAIAAVLQLGVTVDYSIFLYHRYVDERPHYDDRRDAMATAIVAAFRSLSGSSMTTVAGFLALCFMRMTLGRDLGLVMVKGVVLGVATVVLVLPSLLLIFDERIERHRHRILIPKLNHSNAFVLRHRFLMTVLLLLMVYPAVYASRHVEQFYKVDETLPADTPSIMANNKLKDTFDMASSHFIVLRDDISGAGMTEIENKLEALDGITSVVSYHKILGSGIPSFFIPKEVSEMLKQGGYQLMMVNSSLPPATDATAEQLAAMAEILEPYDPDAMVTGEGAMYQGMIETSVVDIRVTNIISAAAIYLIVALTFQSLTVPAVLVAAIELAIFINQGISYFKGTQIFFLSPIIISSIQLGATVDYAILMTSRFQEELRGGKSRMEAIRIAADTSDTSIITSALVLFAATLGVSFVTKIGLIAAICLMLARGAFISALISLFFLPALLCLFEPVFNVTSLHWRTAPGERPRLGKRRKSAAEPVPEAAEELSLNTVESVQTAESSLAEQPVPTGRQVEESVTEPVEAGFPV